MGALVEVQFGPSNIFDLLGRIIAQITPQQGELLDISGPVPAIKRQGVSLHDVVAQCAELHPNVMKHLSTGPVYYRVNTAEIPELPQAMNVAITYYIKWYGYLVI